MWKTGKAEGSAIGSSSGLLTWTPVLAQVGSQAFAVRVEDGRGGWATQSFNVTVSLSGANQSPVITSTPAFSAAANAPYVYAVQADDADGDALSYALESGPAGMTIDASTGLVQWTPTAGQLGSHEVIIEVVDSKGGWAKQVYTLTVSEFGDNTAPRITSTPTLTAAIETDYVYQSQAVDDEGDTLTFALTTAPVGMGVDSSTGRVEWTPAAEQIGTHTVELRAAGHPGGGDIARTG